MTLPISIKKGSAQALYQLAWVEKGGEKPTGKPQKLPMVTKTNTEKQFEDKDKETVPRSSLSPLIRFNGSFGVT